MKLSKLSEEHYILVDEERKLMYTIPTLEAREVLGIVDIDRKAEEANGYALYGSPNGEKYLAFREGFVIGYNQALKNKKYTEEDVRNAISFGNNIQYTNLTVSSVEKEMRKFIQSLQSPTEWDVEFVDNKLKLK